jgi:autotransporter-associated beta strand protein
LGQVTFTVNSSLPQSGNNYATIGAAIGAVPANSLTPYVIQISPGTYNETDTISSAQQYITLEGMGSTPGAVILQAGASQVPLSAAGNYLTVENMEILNTAGPTAGQQNAVYATGDKQVYNNVIISGYQDTLQTEGTGRMYFVDSTIQGSVDFIYGASTAYFYQDKIQQQSSGGTSLTAPSTPQSSAYGYVFYDDTLSSGSSNSTALSRAWNSAYGAAAFIDDTVPSSNIGGFANFGSGTTYSTERLVVYGLVNGSNQPINTSGPPYSTTAIWPYQLTAAQAAPYMSATTVFNGWNPTLPLTPIVWNGGNGTWETAANWSSNAVPAAGQGIYIEPSSPASVSLSSSAAIDTVNIGVPGLSGGNPTNTGGTPSTLTLNSGATLNVGGMLHLDGGSSLILSGGSITLPRLDSGNNNNQIIIQGGSSLDVPSWTNSNGAWPSGTITVHNGTLHLGSTGLGPIISLATTAGDVATYNMDASDNLTLRYIQTGSGTSTINLNGPTSTVINGTYGLELGNGGAGGNVALDINGDTFKGINTWIGNKSGTYTVNQTGGVVEQYGNSSAGQEELELAQASNSNVNWNLTGSTAQLNFGCIADGESGTATIIQTAGTDTIDSITYSGQTAPTNLGLAIAQGSGHGNYVISGGTLDIVNGGLRMGYTWAGASSGGKGNFQVIGSASTLTVTGNYQQNTGSTLTAEVNASGLSVMNVTGNVGFSSGALLNIINDVTPISNSTYTLMTWTGTETGTPTLAPATDPNAWSFSTAGGALTLTYVTPRLSWNNSGGTGDGATWDMATSQNWNNGSGVTTFYTNDNVTFNDSNNGHTAVTINSIVNPASVAVNATSNYTFGGSGGIGGTGALTKSGSGKLTLNTINTFSGGTVVTGGTLVAGVNGALADGNVNITGGTLQLGANTGLATITGLSVSGNGMFDVNNDHVVINYGRGSDPIASIAAMLATGYNGGLWNGAGGITSTAVALNSGSYGLGYADAGDAGDPAALASGTVEIKFTLLGDANLDGVVNGIDFGILAANFNKSVSRWDQGDFNYDKLVNGIDFGELAANFNKGVSGASAASDPALVAFAEANGLLADVPEPAFPGLLMMSGPVLLGRRRRRQNCERPGDSSDLTAIPAISTLPASAAHL